MEVIDVVGAGVVLLDVALEVVVRAGVELLDVVGAGVEVIDVVGAGVVLLDVVVAGTYNRIPAAFLSTARVHGIGMQYSSNPDISPSSPHVAVNSVLKVDSLLPPLASIKPELHVRVYFSR